MKEEFKKYQENGGSYRKLAALIGEKNHTYISLAINGWGDYKLSDERKTEVEEKIKTFFNSKQLKIASEYDAICYKAGIIPFNNTINVIASVIKAIRQKALMKITAKSGTGKTTAIKALLLTLPQSVLITAYCGISKKELLEEICTSIGAKAVGKSQKDYIKSIKDYLKNTKKIIFLDEANFIGEKSLEQIRHIQDECENPIILIGTERLDLQIAKSHEQVESRIRASLKLAEFGINEVLMLFEKGEIELSDKQAENIWKKCKNLREVKYLYDDFCELYNKDISKLEEIIKGF